MPRKIVKAESSSFNREIHVPKLAELAEKGIYIGTSSWKYRGWREQVYLDQYTHKRVSKRDFEDNCLREYAQVFPTVCNDSTFYKLPSADDLSALRERVTDSFRFAFKVSRDIVSTRISADHPPNPTWLNADVFLGKFYQKVELLFPGSVYILQFAPIHFEKERRDIRTPMVLITRLHKFFEQIPKELNIKFGVEIRDLEFLSHEKYWGLLNYHKVAHVLNAQTWMPPLSEQIQIQNIFTANYSIVRALTSPGVFHGDAVDEFYPYTKTVEPNLPTREAIVSIIKDSIARGRETYIYVNNRLEGNAPNTIASVLDRVG